MELNLFEYMQVYKHDQIYATRSNYVYSVAFIFLQLRWTTWIEKQQITTISIKIKINSTIFNNSLVNKAKMNHKLIEGMKLHEKKQSPYL